jgi:oxalate decarboxylase
MEFPSRRSLLTAAATVGAAAVASAQGGDEPVIGHKGAPISGPRNPEREQQNPDALRPPRRITVRFPISNFHSRTHM